MCLVERSAFGLNALLGITRRLSLEGKHSKQDDPDGCDQLERIWHVVNNWRKARSKPIVPLTAAAPKLGTSQPRTKKKSHWPRICTGFRTSLTNPPQKFSHQTENAPLRKRCARKVK